MKPNKLDKYLRVLSAIVAILLIIIIILGGKLYGRVRSEAEISKQAIRQEERIYREFEEISNILAANDLLLADSIDTGSNVDTDLGVFKITAYTAGYESTGKNPGDIGYGITASGTEVQEGITIAADWDVLPVGSKVYIEDIGFRWVEDRGGAVKGQHVDIYMDDLGQALEWGVQEKRVYLLGE